MGNKSSKDKDNKKPPPPAGDPVLAITKLRKRVNLLEKREKFLENRMEKAHQNAKIYVKQKNKKRALIELKKKSMWGKEQEKLSGMQINLEHQIMAIENGSINIDTARAMQEGVNHLKIINQHLTIEQVDDVMDATAEAIEDQEEIGQALAGNIISEMENDEELLAELNELTSPEVTDKHLPVTNELSKLPKAPTHPVTLPASDEQEEQELRELAAAMN